MPFYLGPPFFSDRFFTSLSLGYEHGFSEFNSIELNAFSIASYGFNGEGSELIYGFAPSYRHYLKTSRETQKTWISPYFLYLWRHSSRAGSDTKGYFMGLGASVGARLYFSSKTKWFIDIGAGIAYGQFKYIYSREEIPIEGDDGVYPIDYTIPEPEIRWIPRPIVQIGCKF